MANREIAHIHMWIEEKYTRHRSTTRFTEFCSEILLLSLGRLLHLHLEQHTQLSVQLEKNYHYSPENPRERPESNDNIFIVRAHNVSLNLLWT